MSTPLGSSQWMYSSGEEVTQQSLKFNDDESQYLSWTPAAAGNRKTWTWSGWVKRGNLGSAQYVFFAYNGNSDAGFFRIEFNSSNTIRVRGWGTTYLETSALFRDSSAWYHIVLVADTTQSQTSSTASDSRIRLYVNGEQVTAFSSDSMPSQNTDLPINNNITHNLSSSAGYSSSSYYDGYLSDIHFIDGQALDATSFGNTIDNCWKKKDYTGTYGTNGFRLNFQDDVVSEGFNAVTYRGNAGTQSISGLGFSPDFVWTKGRSGARQHLLFDTIRGNGAYLLSTTTNSEVTDTNTLTTFDGDGFTIGSNQNINTSGETYVGWCWKAGGTPTATNSAGAGNAPTSGSVMIDGVASTSALAGSTAATKISANTTRGFSVVTFTADAASGTVAHGLTTAPDLIIAKPVNHAGTNWYVQVPDVLPVNEILNLDSTAAAFNPGANHFDDTVPTNSVFSYGGYMGNQLTGDDKIAYCFHSVAGYSSVSSYTGDGTTDGSKTITTGFQPAFVMMKNASSGSTNWLMFDNTREPDPTIELELNANNNNIEANSGRDVTFTSTGFTVAGNNNINGNNDTYIYMAFADTREAAFWKDVSGQGNHFIPNSLDYRDSLIDSPANNFATLNPLSKGSGTVTFSEGNLKSSTSVSLAVAEHGATFTIPKSGKWYWEAAYTGANTGGSVAALMGIMDIDTQTVGLSGNHLTTTTGDYITYYTHNSGIYENNVLDSSFSGNEAAATVGFALDMDNGYLFVHLNGTYIGGTPDFSTGANHAAEPNTTRTWLPFFSANGGGTVTWTANFGQDSTFAGSTPAGGNTDANGNGTFKYAVPDGYLSLCNNNLPNPTTADPLDNFNTVLYTGNASARSITVGLQPDFTWIKGRSASTSHLWQDTIRGTSKYLISDSTNGDGTLSDLVTSFDSNGISLGTNVNTNTNSATYVSWNWKAGGTPTATNSAGVGNVPTSGSVMIDGSASTTALNGQIAADKISANTKSGFSIVSYTGTGSGSGNRTVNHGLTKKPEFIILKDRDSNSNNNNWNIWHKDAGDGDDYGYFTTAAFTGSAQVIGTDNNVFTLKPNLTTSNESGDNYITYLFHSVEGMTKVGFYTGNNSADGPFVYTGFKPAWILFKRSNSATGSYWNIIDNKRNDAGFGNLSDNVLMAHVNTNEAGLSEIPLDFLSNGFKVRTTGNSVNASGSKYIYLAFAESPFKGTTAK